MQDDCDLCKDGLFPNYGPAPHKCFYKIDGASVGESRPDLIETWPPNFTEDPDVPGLGVYECPNCYPKKLSEAA